MENKKTCLYDKHVALGALISPFGGFDMPIQKVMSILDEFSGSVTSSDKINVLLSLLKEIL